MSEVHKGQIVTEETRKKISIAHIGKNNPSYGKPAYPGSGCGKGSYYTLPNNTTIWIRSTYEHRVIDCLIKNNISFNYEFNRFELNNTTYTPDIYIENIDTYFEIKGYFSDAYKLKYTEFINKYPEIKIRMLFEGDIIHIEKLISNNINIDWSTVGKEMSEVLTTC